MYLKKKSDIMCFPLIILGILCVMVLAACQPTSGAGTLNIIAASQLEDTTQIDILKFTEGGSSDYIYDQTLSDPDVIRQIVDSLNVELSLISKSRCIANYRLVFVHKNSTTEVDYQCTADSPPTLAGGDDFWGDHAVIAPDAFVSLLNVQ